MLRFFLSPGAAQPKKAEARKKTTRPRLVRARLRVALRFLSGKAWGKRRGKGKEKTGFPFLSSGGPKNGFKMPSAVFLRKMRRMGGIFAFLPLYAFLERWRGVKLGNLRGVKKNFFPLWRPRKRPVFLPFLEMWKIAKIGGIW